jgi:hypothetical protein
MRGQEVLVLIVSVISVTVDKDADGLWGTVYAPFFIGMSFLEKYTE